MRQKLVSALSALLLAAMASGADAQDDDSNAIDDTPHITIVGSATTEVVPDLATITLGVTKDAPTAKAAADAVATVAQVVVDAAKAQGVKDADIATQSVSLTQTFEDLHDSQGRYTGRRANGFEAANTIAIRIRDLANAGALAQGLIDKGADSFNGVVFSVEHPQPILDKLAAQAVVNARQQAEMVAQAAGVKLGRVLLVERPSPPPVGGPVMPMARMMAKAMPIEAGTQGLAAEMEVTWQIDQP